jgi:type II secretory pathway component HofQ
VHSNEEILKSLTRLEFQVNRLLSDYESEKETRKRRNDDIDRRLAALERWQAKWGGALIALTTVATICSIVAAVIKLNQ